MSQFSEEDVEEIFEKFVFKNYILTVENRNQRVFARAIEE